MEKESGNFQFQIDHYVEAVLKHRWLIILPFCLAMVVGLYLSFTLPRIYEAGTLILVEPQRVPANYVQSIVSSNLESRISTIKQQILSRTNIEKIINQFNLFSKPKHEKMFMEDKLKSVRERITVMVTRSKARRGSDAFSILFKGPDPEVVMHITNTLASYFIDENLKIREAQASGTSVFLEGELSGMRDRLQEVETNLRAYRSLHMGELPEQLQTNLSIIDTLQKQLDERNSRMREEKNRLSFLASEIEGERKFLGTTVTAVGTESGDAVTIGQLKAQLAALKSSYTDRHPDVVALKKKIADLEAELGNSGSKAPGLSPRSPGGDLNAAKTSIALRNKIRQHAEIKNSINNLANDIGRINQQLALYQQRVERTPSREEELMSLERDYDNIKGSYNSLLNRKLEAEIAVNMEKKQKGEQFRIIDHASLPEKPVSPDLKKLFLFFVAAGLGIGGGLIFLTDYFDTSLTRLEDIEQNLGISVLATIPIIYRTKDLRRRTLRKVMTVLSLFMASCLFAGFAALAFIGPETTTEMIKGIVSSQII
jgi:polysaccharide chain length determinant protein (PEP-CTERM system associated)